MVQSILFKKITCRNQNLISFCKTIPQYSFFKSDKYHPKIPQIPHPLTFRKIKTCSSKLPKYFYTNNLFVGQRNFLWYNPFCAKKNLQKLKSHQFLQVNSSLFIFQSDTCRLWVKLIFANIQQMQEHQIFCTFCGFHLLLL